MEVVFDFYATSYESCKNKTELKLENAYGYLNGGNEHGVL